MSIPEPLERLLEVLAERAHENWARAREQQGWHHGATRDDTQKLHPSLVPYQQLSEDEKAIDREVSGGILVALRDLGYRVTPGEPFDAFREYELIAGTTQQLGDRRQNTANIYLTVNTAIFLLFGLLIKDASLRGPELFWASIPLVVVGFVACFVWRAALRHYRALMGWRFEQLRKIEQSAAMAGSHRLYTRESEEYLAGRRPDQGFPFSRLEASLPWLFVGLYICYVIGLAIMLMRY